MLHPLPTTALPPLGPSRLQPSEFSATKPTSRQSSDADRPTIEKHIIRRTVTKRELKHLHEVEAAAAEIDRLPQRDEAIHAIMRGNFHGWDLVPAILRLAKPHTIRALYVATLGFNTANAGELLRLLDDGQIKTVTFLCSAYFQKASAREFEVLRAGLAVRGQTIVATRTHAKILAARLTDKRCIVVESSANLRSCRNIEQFCMTESPELFAFHQHWIDEAVRQWRARNASETP